MYKGIGQEFGSKYPWDKFEIRSKDSEKSLWDPFRIVPEVKYTDPYANLAVLFEEELRAWRKRELTEQIGALELQISALEAKKRRLMDELEGTRDASPYNIIPMSKFPLGDSLTPLFPREPVINQKLILKNPYLK